MTSSSSSPFDYSRTVHYKSADHLAVIFQVYGSVWPKVLPHCAGTVTVTAAILAAERYYDTDLTISEWGHQFMSVIVAFLVVSRCTITFSLYYEFRGYVTQILAATRDFVQLTTAMTPAKAADFRSDATLQALLLVRATVAMLKGQPAWENRSDDQPSLRHIINHGSGSNPTDFLKRERFSNYGMIVGHEDETARWIQRRHTSADKNLAIPLRLVYKLRETVIQNRRQLNLDTIQEQQLLACLQDFLRGYDGLRKYLTTPFPFPLAQMARTFLFLYVYSIPFALLSAVSKPIQSLVLVFIVTYGFLGLEYVTIELEDPFGDDPSDLPVTDLATGLYEDCCIVIADKDGVEAAKGLLQRVLPVTQVLPTTENSPLV